jgi:hypothetical protein
MPREQVMCAAVSCGSAADDVGLAGASLKWCRSLISGARRFAAKLRRRPAMWHNLKARSTAHCFLLIAAGATVRAIFHKCCRAFGPDLVRCALLGQAIGIDAGGSVQYQYP